MAYCLAQAEVELDLIRDRKKKVKAFMKEATMVSSFTVALSIFTGAKFIQNHLVDKDLQRMCQSANLLLHPVGISVTSTSLTKHVVCSTEVSGKDDRLLVQAGVAGERRNATAALDAGAFCRSQVYLLSDMSMEEK